MSTILKQENLDRLPQTVKGPDYDRTKLTPGFLHFGLGNFQRSHMAIYLEALFELGETMDWGVIAASLRPSSATTRDRLKTQDWLSTVIELNPAGLTASVIGSLIDYVPIDPDAVLAALIDPRIRIVTLTITEGGYFIDAATGGLTIDDPQIKADATNPQAPRTIFGLIIKALALRKDQGTEAFTVLSLDNLPGNGRLTKQTTVDLARLSDPTLADWIEAQVAFPNCMVDCIAPATSDRERDLVVEQFGVKDAVPVVCESFRQWVIEDHFPAGRPPLEKVGVEFVDDVSNYELMKLRIANGGHASFCYAAALLGYQFGHEALADPDLLNWSQALLRREAIPTLKPLPGVDYDIYLNKVMERFSNPEIDDTIARLAFCGSDRQPMFILPMLQDRLDADGPIDGLALEIALWCRYCTCADEAGNSIELQDSRATELKRRATQATTQPNAFLEFTAVFGNLNKNSRFSDAFGLWLKRIHKNGVRSTIKQYVSTCT